MAPTPIARRAGGVGGKPRATQAKTRHPHNTPINTEDGLSAARPGLLAGRQHASDRRLGSRELDPAESASLHGQALEELPDLFGTRENSERRLRAALIAVVDLDGRGIVTRLTRTEVILTTV